MVFPGEKKENMLKTMELALRLKQEFDVGMHLFFATLSYGHQTVRRIPKRKDLSKRI
jgi:hypothetical protein